MVAMSSSPYQLALGQVSALAETGIWEGIEYVSNPMWYETKLLEPLMKHCPSLAYALTYTNFDDSDYWVPVDGQTTYPGFMEFYEVCQMENCENMGFPRLVACLCQHLQGTKRLTALTPHGTRTSTPCSSTTLSGNRARTTVTSRVLVLDTKKITGN